MKLDEFIESSLVQIIEGVRKAQKTTMDTNKQGNEAYNINPAHSELLNATVHG